MNNLNVLLAKLQRREPGLARKIILVVKDELRKRDVALARFERIEAEAETMATFLERDVGPAIKAMIDVGSCEECSPEAKEALDRLKAVYETEEIVVPA